MLALRAAASSLQVSPHTLYTQLGGSPHWVCVGHPRGCSRISGLCTSCDPKGTFRGGREHPHGAAQGLRPRATPVMGFQTGAGEMPGPQCHGWRCPCYLRHQELEDETQAEASQGTRFTHSVDTPARSGRATGARHTSTLRESAGAGEAAARQGPGPSCSPSDAAPCSRPEEAWPKWRLAQGPRTQVEILEEAPAFRLARPRPSQPSGE